jgi:agmatine/peptidylarginine deiminase
MKRDRQNLNPDGVPLPLEEAGIGRTSMKRSCLILFLLAALLLLFASSSPASSPTFTPPPAESLQPLGEWEGKRRLVMVFYAEPPQSAKCARGLLDIRNAYLHVLREALPLVNVTVVAPTSQNVLDLATWVHQNGLGKYLRDGRLSIENHNVDSIWIRDYSPILARGETSGTLYAVDPVYAQDTAENGRYYDDRLAYWLFRDTPVRWVRPHLVLDGGNFDTDGSGLCFSSKKVFGDNAQAPEEITATFKRYLGCQKIFFLEPIPLESTGHLDMFFKVLSPNMWVLGQYLPRRESKDPIDHLEYLASVAMEKNAASLENFLRRRGKGRLIRMPMPRPYLFEDFCRETLDWNGENGESEQLRKEMENRFSKEIGYASYLNSIYLRGARGEVLILPSYIQKQYREKAAAIYRKAFPRAKIIWMPSEFLIQEEGAAHCVLYGMPE